jgi:hypothetical protein
MVGTDVEQQRTERCVKRDRVFILGAGFSVVAGVPVTPALLKKAMNSSLPSVLAFLNASIITLEKLLKMLVLKWN